MTMAGRATTRRRQHLIDVARMLGYSIEPSSKSITGAFTYELRLFGQPVTQKVREQHPNGTVQEWYFTYTPRYRNMWRAAEAAIKNEGLNPDALEPPRKDGALVSAAPEVFLRRNQSERTHHRTAKAAAQRKRNR